LIQLLAGADLSTFLHEAGRLWLELMQKRAAAPQHFP
jgi:hypothetical protein